MQVCTSLHTDNHASTPPLSFFTGRISPSCRPTNSVKALKAKSSGHVHDCAIRNTDSGVTKGGKGAGAPGAADEGAQNSLTKNNL